MTPASSSGPDAPSILGRIEAVLAAASRRLAAAWARVEALDLLPRSARYPTFAQIRPRGALAWASVAILLAAFLFYANIWVTRQPELLFDPQFENDDVRTALFPYHRFGPDHALRDDPIANEMLHFTMPGITALYRVLVPIAGIFVAPKAVQAIALALLIWAAVVMARSRRGGLAPALLMVFLILRQAFFVNRLAGGFGRAFTFPCFALWLAGALTNNPRARWSAILIGALTQNYTVAILLGAEGIESILPAWGKRRRVLLQRAKHYLVIVLASLILIGAYLFGNRGLGTVQTLDQVESSQAFRARHKGEYPLADPAPHFVKGVLEPFLAGGEALPGTQARVAEVLKEQSTWPLTICAALLMMGLMRISPRARAAAAFLCASIVLYTLSRYLAYKLYAPERYYSFGAPMAGVALGVIAIGLVGPRLRRHRSVVRNLAAASFIIGLTAIAGDGIVARNGMTIDRYGKSDLYDFVSTLPPMSRIACHPWDGDNIPWWSGRATTGGYETAQMWLVEGALRVEKRTDAVLSALYATSRPEVLAYAKRAKITHFLIHTDRYKGDVVKKAGFIEPMTTFATKLVGDKEGDDFVLASPPKSAIIYQDKSTVIVDVALLTRAWKKDS